MTSETLHHKALGGQELADGLYGGEILSHLVLEGVGKLFPHWVIVCSCISEGSSEQRALLLGMTEVRMGSIPGQERTKYESHFVNLNTRQSWDEVRNHIQVSLRKIPHRKRGKLNLERPPSHQTMKVQKKEIS